MIPKSAAEAERHAEQLRADLGDTLDTLASNLAPKRLASEVAAAARDRTPDWVKDFASLARGPVGLGLVGAATASIALSLLARRRWR